MRRKSVSIYTAHSSSVVSRSSYFYLSHVSNYASTSYDHHINLEKSKGYIGTTVAPFGSPTNSFSFYKLIHYGTILSAKKESLSCILQVIFLFLNCNLLYIQEKAADWTSGTGQEGREEVEYILSSSMNTDGNNQMNVPVKVHWKPAVHPVEPLNEDQPAKFPMPPISLSMVCISLNPG